MYFVSGGMGATFARIAQGMTARALALGPAFVDIRLKLADACRDKGDHAESLAQFDEILKINPNYLPGRVHYGIALYSAGRKEDAVKCWEDVLERNPGNRSAEMYLNLVKDNAKDTVKVDQP